MFIYKNRKLPNMKKSEDLRVVKTKRAIRVSLTKLLAEKDLDDITIKEIAENAEINRKTFYNHYTGIHQLVHEIEDELIETFNKTLKKRDLVNDLKNLPNLYKELSYILLNEENLRSHIEKFGFHSSLTKKLAEAVKISLMSVLSEKLDLDETILKIIIEYWVAGEMAVFELWYREGAKETIEQINETVGILSSSGIQGFLKES